MIKRVWWIVALVFFLVREGQAQHRFYKNPDKQVMLLFKDSADRVTNLDPGSLLRKQFDYILAFHPRMQAKAIQVKYRSSPKVVRTRPKFSSIFKMPGQRIYTITFSTGTKTTLDSVLLNNLSFNAQLGLLANQVSMIEEMSTGGFFNFIEFYLKQLTRRGRTSLQTEAELKTLEVGLGYQLLDLNREWENKLQIQNWTSTKGYTNYFRNYRNRSMSTQKVVHFMNDLPVYISNNYW